MHTITITLSDDRLAKLQEMAARLHISPEELARAGVEALLARPEETCQRAIDYVLKKNAELYRRLGECGTSPSTKSLRYITKSWRHRVGQRDSCICLP